MRGLRKRPKAAKMKNEGTGAESDDERKDTMHGIGFSDVSISCFFLLTALGMDSDG